MVLASARVPAPRFRGLEQFELVASTGGVNYCIANSRPYALEFSNSFDVICLLLGDINTKTKFEDDREQGLTFLGETSAFHPRGGNVRVAASEVRHGFIAFGYSPEFQTVLDEFAIEKARVQGSRNNISHGAIRHLARYARERIRSPEGMEPIEIQLLASLVFLETIRHLGAMKDAKKPALSDLEFEAICDYVDGELDKEITCLGIASAVNVPLRLVFDGVRQRTGYSPYRFVLEKRIERAKALLRFSDTPISEVALSCGFSSQQHLTSTLSRKLGATPLKLRNGD